MDLSNFLSRRRFLQQSFAFSALAGMSAVPSFAATAGSTNLLMVGDWGAENTRDQSRVAAGMQSYVRALGLKTDALLMLGDNWYGPLPDGAKDTRWKSGFEEMYPKSVFDCVAYAIPGNHDYQRMPMSKLDAELEYARQGGSRWTMPSRWYSFTFPAKNPLMTVIALDSNMPNPKGPQATGVNFTLTNAERLEQLAWLTAELEKPLTTPWLVVMGHHPVFSNGPHGDTATLVQDWEPLLRTHKVHLYLAGHDHDMQHLEFEGHPTSFALSGGGGADLYNLKIQPTQRGPYAEKINGFSHLEVTPDRLVMRHLNSSGKTIHSFAKTVDGGVTIL
jgi:tartrate-resistant acid phosphatase type 5